MQRGVSPIGGFETLFSFFSLLCLIEFRLNVGLIKDVIG